MPFIIAALITAVIPVIVAEVAKLLIGSAIEKEAQKRAWVTGFVQDLQPLLDKWLPAIAKPAEGDLIIAVEAAFNEALDKIEGANSADTVQAGTVNVSDATGTPVAVNDSVGNAVGVQTKQ